jgi:hypothetical protein
MLFSKGLGLPFIKTSFINVEVPLPLYINKYLEVSKSSHSGELFLIFFSLFIKYNDYVSNFKGFR